MTPRDVTPAGPRTMTRHDVIPTEPRTMTRRETPRAANEDEALLGNRYDVS